MKSLLASLFGALVLLAAASLAATEAFAQTGPAPQANPRPKIGLVLSGGGARGAAHVGVLKVLEEMRIPVDYIAGTSMGSIVGGSYATGMPIPEMEKELARIRTVDLFTDTPPRKDIPVRRKQEDRQIFFGPEFGFNKWALQLPKGAISGIALEAELRKLVPLKGPRNFDELPIPYRAVATDIVSGLPHVFVSGEVAVAMRASMSIPGAVSPAEIGGNLYVDGGLVDNLPVDVARKMGADVVIAVNLGTPLMTRDQITSIVGVVGQMINILTEQNVRASLASLKPEDILILPELGNFSATDFDNLPKTVPIGEAAARKVADRLARYSVSPEEYAAWKAKREAENPASGRKIDEIRVEGVNRVNPEVIVSTMDTSVGDPVDQDVIDADLRRIYGRGDFEHLGYRVIDEQSRRILAVDATEKSWGPNYLRFGLGLSTDFQGETYFNLLARYRSTWMNKLGGEFRADAQIGQVNKLAAEFYQPLTPNAYFFVAPNASVQSYPINLFSDGVKIAQYNVRSAQAGLDLGSQFTKYGELRVGATVGQLKFDLDSGSLFFPRSETVQQGAFVGKLYVDQIDSLRFPRSGYVGTARVYASRSALGADDQYTKWDFDFAGAGSLGRHALALGVRAGGKIGSDPLPFYDQFQWGGFLQMSGYRIGEILSQQLQFARLVYTYKLADIPLLEGVYVGASAEAANVTKAAVPGGPSGFLKSGSLFVALDSPIGPIYFAYGKAFDGAAPSSFYFFLGIP
jgi:NTE family protein